MHQGASWNAFKFNTCCRLSQMVHLEFLWASKYLFKASWLWLCFVPSPSLLNKEIKSCITKLGIRDYIAYYNCWKQHSCFFYKVDWPEVLITPDSSSNHALTMLCHLLMICPLRTRGCEPTFPFMELFSHVENEGVSKGQNSCPSPYRYINIQCLFDTFSTLREMHGFYTITITYIDYILYIIASNTC